MGRISSRVSKSVSGAISRSIGGKVPTIPVDLPAITCVYQLNDSGAVAGAFGYLHAATNAPDYQRADVTLLTAETAANNVYLGLADDPLGTDAVNVGTDVVALGFEVIDHTGATADIFGGGPFCGFGMIWGGGASSYAWRAETTAIGSRNISLTPEWSGGVPGASSVADTGAVLSTNIQKIAMYFNGSTGRIGMAYFNHNTSQWVDNGYDPTASFTGALSPYIFVDNDAVPIPALNGSVVSCQLRTDKSWFSGVPLPVGTKTVCGEVI